MLLLKLSGEYKSIKFLNLANILILLAGILFIPLYSLFVKDLGGSMFDAGLALAAFALAALIGSFLINSYIEQVKDKKKMVVLGYLIVALGFILLTTVMDVFNLIIIQVIIGFGYGVYSNAMDVMILEYLKKDVDDRWICREALVYFVIALVALLGGYLLCCFSYQVLFLMMAALAIFSASFLYFSPKNIFK